MLQEVNDKSKGGFEVTLDFVNSGDTAALGFAAIKKVTEVLVSLKW